MMERNFPQYQGDVFKNRFKYYKSNAPHSFFDKVITTGYSSIDGTRTQENYMNKQDERVTILGLKDTKSWKVSLFAKHPGLILINNPFTSLGQRFWIRKCLQDYSRKPNKTNIDVERYIEDWWKECYRSDGCDRKLQKKMRWTTLGYHHNWDTKEYTEVNKNAFPDDLAELCDVVALYMGYSDFRPEAAIVNYYHMGSTLSGHTDHSEINLDAPLFSFSFGQSAIFLIGGQDKSIEPSAILLNSGDILIMSKEARLCYHAVPKILPASNLPWNDQENMKTVKNNGAKFKFLINEMQMLSEMNENIDNKAWNNFNMYVEESRININVRQVLKPNQNSLYDIT